MKNPILLTLVAGALSLAAGCFNEPEPAYKTVPPEARVYLQDRGLVDLSTCTAQLKAGAIIDYVNLDRNRLAVFPSELTHLTGLKWLRLNSNQLAQLPDLKALTHLRRIYLKDNRFTTVPETLKDLPFLTDIDLSGNPIAEIPDWLAAKKGLEGLSFSRTRITKLPADLSAWRTLKQLQLGGLKLSAEEMARIRRALPKVAIVF